MCMSWLKELKWNAVLISVLFLVLGVILIAWPGITAKMLCNTLAWILIVIGAVDVVTYFLRSMQKNIYRNDLVSGLLLILLGCFVLYKVELVISLVPFILGFFIVFSGIGKLQNAVDLKRMGYGNWWLVLLLAAISLAAGVVMIRNPFTTAELLFRLIGVSLAYSGVTDLFSTFYLEKKLKRFKKEMEKDIIDI